MCIRDSIFSFLQDFQKLFFSGKVVQILYHRHLSASIGEQHCFLAVSYTHLDVYKRQHIGVAEFHRAFGEVEVVSPLEKSGDIVFIQLRTDDPVSGSGYGDKSIGHLLALTAAVVCPQVVYLCFQIRFDVIDRHHRGFYCALFVKAKVGKGVHNGLLCQSSLYTDVYKRQP